MKDKGFLPLPEDIEAKKKKLWSRVESRLSPHATSQESFQMALERFFQAVMPSRLARMQSKEKLFLRLSSLEPLRAVPSKALPFSQSLLKGLNVRASLKMPTASLLLASFMVVLFFPVSLVLPQAYAWSEDNVVLEKGSLFVNGLSVSGVQALKAGDIVKTGKDSQAQIYLADDSRIAMAENTTLRLIQSSMEPQMHPQSVVEHVEGQLWVQVVNLVHSEFQLRVPEAELIVDYQSSFWSSVDQDKVRVDMFHHMLQLSEPTLMDQEMVLMAGTSLLLEGQDWRLRSMDQAVEDPFIRENLEKEVLHKKDRLQGYEARLGDGVWIDADHFLYPVKRLREKVQEKVVPSGVLKDKVLQTHAKERLKEYHQALNAGSLDQAKQLAQDFDETRDKIDSEVMESEIIALEIQSQKWLVLDNKEPLLVETQASKELSLMVNTMMNEAIQGESEALQISWASYQDSLSAYVQNIDQFSLQEREKLLLEFLEAKKKEKLLLETVPVEEKTAWEQKAMQNLNTLLLSVQMLNPEWSVVQGMKNADEEKKMLQVLAESVYLEQEVKTQVEDFVRFIQDPQPVLLASPSSLQFSQGQNDQESSDELVTTELPVGDSETLTGEAPAESSTESVQIPEPELPSHDPRFEDPRFKE